MTTELPQQPHFSFGAPGSPITLALGSSFIFGHLCHLGEDAFQLWLGVGSPNDCDAVFEGIQELRIFQNWLLELPANPHLNQKIGVHIKDLNPELNELHEGVGDFHLSACLALSDQGSLLYVIGADKLDQPDQWKAHTTFHPAEAKAFAALITQLMEAIGNGMNLSPLNNPLDTEEDVE